MLKGRLTATYRLTADIWMPDLGLELHDRRTERVFIGYLNVHKICTVFVGRAWGAFEGTPEMSEVVTTSQWISRDLRMRIRVDVCDFFRDTAVAIGSHGVRSHATESQTVETLRP